jgi:hypothetical protein
MKNTVDIWNKGKVRIRKNSLSEDVFLSRQGEWVSWKLAAQFASQNAAEKFAHKHGIEIFGLV